MKPTPLKKLTILGFYSALALAVFMLESALPPVPVPGIKLGLANIITLLTLSRYSSRDAALVLTVRIIIAGLFAGQAVYILYSVCGGGLCLIAMSLSNRLLKGRYIYLTSIVGAIAHNTGQILAAFFVLGLSGILVYIPYMMISAVATGLFTGLVCHYALKHLPKDPVL